MFAGVSIEGSQTVSSRKDFAAHNVNIYDISLFCKCMFYIFPFIRRVCKIAKSNY